MLDYLLDCFVVVAATLDGSIAFLQPVTEKMYRRLLMLQNALCIHLNHTAGLHPKAFRFANFY